MFGTEGLCGGLTLKNKVEILLGTSCVTAIQKAWNQLRPKVKK